MLLDFTVENFRSIKGAETLSAVTASKSKAKPSNSESRRRVKSDDEIAQPFHVEGWNIDVLPVIAIFGANASGKSNVLKALEYLLGFMVQGVTEGECLRELELIPFRLDKQSRESPSFFNLRTVFDGTIYTYYLVIDNTRIIVEELKYALANTKRDRLLFRRTWNEEELKFDWKNGSDFFGSHIKLEKSLKEREPFISLFINLSIEIVQPLIAWSFFNYLDINWEHRKLDWAILEMLWGDQYPNESKELTMVIENTKNLLLKLDTGLYDIEIRKDENNKEDYQLYALHKVANDEIISWRFEEESIGTQRLFDLVYKMQFKLLRKGLLIADEFGSNVHPNIINEIVKLFQSPKTNPNRTQLIFTSHDNTLQRNNLLRRDQIWFTQKRPDQSTELYSLSDFKVRNDLAIDKAYLDGRFGAVPFISDEDDFMPVGEDNG